MGDDKSTSTGPAHEAPAGSGQPSLRRLAAKVLPEPLRIYLRRRFPADPLATPPLGRVDWGGLRRTTPISADFGFDRGSPIDRHYIEQFLSMHAGDVAGRVLEVKDAGYTRRLGGGRVTQSDVLDIDASNPNATIVTDLNDARELPTAAFDCIVLTQVLPFVYDVRAALRDLHRSLKPGGVILITVPGITPIAHAELGHTWFWSFSQRAIERLVAEHFPERSITSTVYGNVLAATAFLHGVAFEEVTSEDLKPTDPNYQVIVGVRAMKPAE